MNTKAKERSNNFTNSKKTHMNTLVTTRMDTSMKMATEISTMTNWTKVDTRGTATLYSKTVPSLSSTLEVSRIEATLPGNIDTITSILHDNIGSQQEMRSETQQLTILDCVDENTKVVLLKLKGMPDTPTREFLGVQQVKRSTTTGQVVIMRTNLESHPNMTVDKDAMRGEILLYHTELTKIDERNTKFVLHILLDPKGTLHPTLLAQQKISQLMFLEKLSTCLTTMK